MRLLDRAAIKSAVPKHNEESNPQNKPKGTTTFDFI
jgi:hypothetical protein